MKTSSSFLDRLIERMDRLDPSSLQTYVLRLAREKGFLETIFNTIQEGVIVIDSRLRMRYTNSVARNLLGIQEDAHSARIDRYLRDIDWRSLLDAEPGEWRRVSRQEIEVFYPGHRYVSFYLVPIETDTESDELPLATIILQDVTETHEHTEKTVESKRVEAITMLAAGVAHELGNPLNSLNIHHQLLARYLDRIADKELAREARETLDIATGEVARLDAIVSNFLRAVRPVPPNMTRLQIKQVLADALKFMQTEIESRNILVEATWPDSLPGITGDPDQLKQAFYNIIKNSIQAMPDGGILRIVCAEHGEFLDVCFADTGKGISSDDLSRIMEPYFTTRPDGTGLGLLIVNRIVRSHGGELVIESGEQDAGTAFTVRLPLRERRARLLKAGEEPVETHTVPEHKSTQA